jgi:hypothetical protein
MHLSSPCGRRWQKNGVDDVDNGLQYNEYNQYSTPVRKAHSLNPQVREMHSLHPRVRKKGAAKTLTSVKKQVIPVSEEKAQPQPSNQYRSTA